MTPKLAEAAADGASSAGSSESGSGRGRLATVRYYLGMLLLFCILVVVLWFVLSAVAPGVAAVTEGIGGIAIVGAMLVAPVWVLLHIVKTIRQHTG